MKLLITVIMLLNFMGDSRADDRSCKKECREIYRTCLDKVEASAEDTYLDLDSITYRISSETLRNLYQHTEDSHKEAKALCRKDQKSCVETCNQD
jgi:hypothetical protein